MKNKYYILIAFISIILWGFILKKGIIGWLDGWMYMFDLDITKYIYYWSENIGLWEPGSHNWAHLLQYFFRSLFWKNIYLYQFSFFSLLFSVLFVGIKLCLKYLYLFFQIKVEDRLFDLSSLLLSLLYVFNPINISYRLVPIIGNSYLFFLIPIFIALWYRFLYKQTYSSWILFILILSLFSNVLWILPQMLWVFFFLLLSFWFLFFMGKIKLQKNFWRKLFLMLSIFILLNFYWIVPFLHTGMSAVNNATKLINPVENIRVLSQILHFFQLFFLYISDHRGMLDSSNSFFRNSIVSYGWYSFFSFVLLYTLFQRDKRIFNLFLFFLFLIFIDLSNPSWFFSYLIVKFIDTLPLLALYRTAFDKLIYFPILVFVFFVANWLMLSRNKFFPILTIFIVVSVNSVPLFSGSLLENKIWTNVFLKKENPLFGDLKMLDKNIIFSGNSRVLFLPLYGNDRVVGSWHYFGLDHYSEFISWPFLWSYSYKFNSTKNLLESIVSGNVEEFNKGLKILWIGTIVRRKDTPEDFLTGLDLSSLNPQNLHPINHSKVLKDNPQVIFSGYVRNFPVYRVLDATTLFSGSNMFTEKINPIKYSVSFKRVDKIDFSFLETFDNNRKLFLNKNNFWPVKGKKNTYYIFFQWEELKYLREKPIFEETHHLVNDYANGRTLDAEYIKKNFPKDYYKENPDGSIDVNLTLYFRPQSYFYLWLGVSGLTFFWLIAWLLVDRRRQKNLVQQTSAWTKNLP